MAPRMILSTGEMQKGIAKCTPHSQNRMIFILRVLGGMFSCLVLTSTKMKIQTNTASF